MVTVDNHGVQDNTVGAISISKVILHNNYETCRKRLNRFADDLLRMLSVLLCFLSHTLSRTAISHEQNPFA
jgi:hypothetical protein